MTTDYAANVALFLIEKTNSCTGFWSGKLLKAEQVDLFGTYLGRGTLLIDGATETITHSIKVCFGTDTSWTAQIKFDGSVVFKN